MRLLIKFFFSYYFSYRKIIDRLIEMVPAKFKLIFGIYPVILGNEIKSVKKILKSRNWNFTEDISQPHYVLEKHLAERLNSENVVIVNSGGMAFQMLFRVFGFKMNSQVIHQIDTCIATPFSILNSQLIPIFCDSNLENFQMDTEDVKRRLNNETKAIVGTHMWGNIEDITTLNKIAKKNNILLIEDCCLALGSKFLGKSVGTNSDASIFSFGSTKSIQGGGGGAILVKEYDLAKELRSMRNWGSKDYEFGINDVTKLSWNGKLSEIHAAIILEQLKNFEKIQNKMQLNIDKLKPHIENLKFLDIIEGHQEIGNQSNYNSLVLKINNTNKVNKKAILSFLKSNGIECYDANFKPVNKFSFFSKGIWKNHIPQDFHEEIQKNYELDYENANKIYNDVGINIYRSNFISKLRTNMLIKTLNKLDSRFS